ncbi:MAG: hypothetical protein M3347_00180 [Armatimonadota bacterium]|nr:hypothetical protein [Armatimonadota bacterium]
MSLGWVEVRQALFDFFQVEPIQECVDALIEGGGILSGGCGRIEGTPSVFQLSYQRGAFCVVQSMFQCSFGVGCHR